MTKAPDLAAGASTPDRGRVEAHRVFARADQDGLRWLLQVNPSVSAARDRTRANPLPRINIPYREEKESGGGLADPYHPCFPGGTDPSAAAIRACPAARERRRLCPRLPHCTPERRRHPCLCRTVRSGRVRRGARAGRTLEHRAPRL